MPNRYSKNKIFENYEKLPEELKDALTSVNISDQLFEIGKKFNLTVEKMGLMAEEIGYIILGFTKPQEFTSLLQKNLEVDTEIAGYIASEINHKIFFPLREALKQAHQVEIQIEAGIHAPLPERRETGQYGADRKQETQEGITEKITQPKPPQTLVSASTQLPKPPELPKPEPAKPMPIDLRDLRKPSMSASLPEIIGPAKPPPEIPKPSLPKPPEPAKPITPKPIAPPRPEVMSNGGMFAAPMTMSKLTPPPKPTSVPSPLIKPPTSPMPKPQEIKKQPLTEKGYDPYREPVE